MYIHNLGVVRSKINLPIRSSRFLRLVVPTMGAVIPIEDKIKLGPDWRRDIYLTILCHDPCSGDLCHGDAFLFCDLLDPAHN